MTMAAFIALVATSAVVLSADSAAARKVGTAVDLPAHLIVPDTGLRCGEVQHDVCCPSAYGACAPGMVCMGKICRPCGDDGEPECDDGASSLWSATFLADSGDASPAFLPLRTAGIEAQSGLYGYYETDAYGDVFGAYGDDDLIGAYGESLNEDIAVIVDGKYVQTGADAEALSSKASDGSNVGEETNSNDKRNYNTQDESTAEAENTTNSVSIASAGAVVAGVAVLLVGIGALAYSKRAALARPTHSAV